MHHLWDFPVETNGVSHLYKLKYPDNGVAFTRYLLLESIFTFIYGTGTTLGSPENEINVMSFILYGLAFLLLLLVLARIWRFYQHRKRREASEGQLDPYEILTFENYLRRLLLLNPSNYSTSRDITRDVITLNEILQSLQSQHVSQQ
ncbi:hypothetical protein TNIN_19241 [Trichonephila inaurata madagascariensis]|uniref:Uncharacterized protein n=1 Tax=Trichonephila inaurata madagascariensis TaxID=2747483 RepID=A0A8X6XHS6_9ARAC|nr:hypothetical protein TNIN_19241 [Trichonephila inaurata madagascariensis]